MDGVRGVAVMAILWVNILSFAMPDTSFLSPAFYVPPSAVDAPVWVIQFLFADGKFRGLFTLLFGAGMMLVMDRAEASGQSPIAAHLRRMAWLWVIGVGHSLLLWHGDILMTYAVMGFVLTGFHSARGEQLVRWGAALLVAGSLWMVWMMAGRIPAMASVANIGGDGVALALIAEFHAEDLAELQRNIISDLALFHGSYAAIFVGHIEKFGGSLRALPIAAMETLPLMMIGVGLYRTGFLSGAWERQAYRRWLRRCLPWGLLLTALPALYVVMHGFDAMLVLVAHLGLSVAGRLLLIIAYAAALILWLQRHCNGAMAQRIAAAGRMALSNYLGSSLVMTTIFYGYGLGLFGRVPIWGLYAFTAAGCAAMLLWSPWWLARFHYGPAEWLWRSLARWQMQPFRRV